MILYFAGAESHVDRLYQNGVRDWLISYYYLRADWDFPEDVRLFVDSGAFSAWKSGKHIELRDYIEWLKRNQGRVVAYANLDVIGDVQGTAANQRTMERSGLRPLPVFHYGSDRKVFERMCRRYDYVCLGGMVALSGQSARGRNKAVRLTSWLRLCFDIAIRAKAKVHGFGMTLPTLLKAFPWYSVDSTSWLEDQKYASASRFAKGTILDKGDFINRTYGRWGSTPYKPRIGASMVEWMRFTEHVTEFHQATGIYGYWEGRKTTSPGDGMSGT